METLLFICKLFMFLILAEFITGFVHFMLDQYGKHETPIIGSFIVTKNSEHHHFPRRVVEQNYLKLTHQSWVLFVLIIGGLKFFVGYFSLELTIALAIGANANVIHQWTHRTKKENGKLITFMQENGIVQSRKHHGWHHAAPYDTNYCVMTDWLNPVLHKTHFWDLMVSFFKIIGIKPVVRA